MGSHQAAPRPRNLHTAVSCLCYASWPVAQHWFARFGGGVLSCACTVKNVTPAPRQGSRPTIPYGYWYGVHAHPSPDAAHHGHTRTGGDAQVCLDKSRQETNILLLLTRCPHATLTMSAQNRDQSAENRLRYEERITGTWYGLLVWPLRRYLLAHLTTPR